MRLMVLGAIAALVNSAYARVPAPILLPTGSWKGDDGNWSTLSFSVGSQLQPVDVLASTGLSEFWVVGPGGCDSTEAYCGDSRGNTFSPSRSTDWKSLGTWSLGLTYLGFGGNGEYGTDELLIHSPSVKSPIKMTQVLTAAINTTDYLTGMFGLGIIQGTFGKSVVDSPLTQAVKEFGLIPSYSYGFTAGAHYRNSPVSLILGGYAKSRFKAHDNAFTLGQSDDMPHALVRGIEATASDSKDLPDGWKSDSKMLTTFDDSFQVLIDSSTPFLWLPDGVCDTIANALDLKYNKTLDVYTLTDKQYTEYSKADSLNFNFILSSFDNTNNFGQPYDMDGIVNITIPARALVSLLEYPFNGDVLTYGAPSVPYFMLRRAGNSPTYIIGRSFLQESYLITTYDEASFSIHQAEFPNESARNPELTPIKQPDNSPYPGPAKQSSGTQSKSKNNDKKSTGLSSGAYVGIGVSAGVLVLGLIIATVWCCRSRRKPQSGSPDGFLDDKTLPPTPPRSPMHRIFSIFLGRKESRTPTPHHEDIEHLRRTELDGSAQPVEMFDPHSTRTTNTPEAHSSPIYEMATTNFPVELYGDIHHSLDNSAAVSPQTPKSVSAYNLAQR